MSGAAGIPTVHGGEEVNGPEARSATVSAAGMSSGVELPPRRRSWANHGGQAHAQAWACEAPQDHPRVAGPTTPEPILSPG